MRTTKTDPTTEEVARRRARFYLLDKWARQLEEAGLADTAGVVRGYRPSGWSHPVDVAEIGGLVVTTDVGETHLRLYRDSTVGFIGAGLRDREPIAIDPMSTPIPRDRYLSGGVSETVREVLEALDVTPRWADACPDGGHTFTTADERPPYQYVKCDTSNQSAEVLSWLGHAVPYQLGGDAE